MVEGTSARYRSRSSLDKSSMAPVELNNIDATITIYVKYRNPWNIFGADKLYQIECGQSEKLCEVRNRIAKFYNLNPNHLYFGGREIDDCASI